MSSLHHLSWSSQAVVRSALRDALLLDIRQSHFDYWSNPQFAETNSRLCAEFAAEKLHDLGGLAGAW